MEKKEKTRAFIAVDFPSEVVKEIARMQELLGKKKFVGKLTELENLHLTLKFLGEINSEQLNKLKTRLKTIQFKPFNAFLEYAGTFVRHNNPNIVWLKVGGSGIIQLQKQIDESLKGLFKPESRFMSHLTIARVKYAADKQDFIEDVKQLKVQKINFTISEFKLKSSELNPLGPVYTDLETYNSIF